MSKLNLYSLSTKDKVDIFSAASGQTRMPAHAVEKDWWVVQTLGIIFELTISEHLVFKGGTSLSKGWKLIERFSEDIDLAIDRKFFGFNNNDLGRKDIDRLRRTVGSFIDEELFEALRLQVSKKGFNDVRLEIEAGERSDRDRVILLHYPNVIDSPGYLSPNVKIEFSCRSLMEPSSQQSFGSIIDETFADTNFAEPLIKVPTVNPERTLLEKIFLLHEEFQKPANRIRSGDRLSRHLYDVAKLSATGFADVALSDAQLYRNIVAHRQHFNAIPGVDYAGHIPQQINIIPTDGVLAAWKADYQTMIEEMIYDENPPSFQDLIDTLQNLNKRINELTWAL